MFGGGEHVSAAEYSRGGVVRDPVHQGRDEVQDVGQSLTFKRGVAAHVEGLDPHQNIEPVIVISESVNQRLPPPPNLS